MTEVIGLIAIKGGVGKTTCTASLGDALASLKKNVLVIDANFSAPNLGLHFGIIDPAVTLHDVLIHKIEVKKAIIEINPCLSVLPSTLHGGRVDHRKLRKKILKIKKNYDFILIDSSPQMNSEMLATLCSSNKAIIVSTPDLPTLSLTMAVLKAAKKSRIEVIGIILNRVSQKDFELTREDIEQSCKIPIIGVVKEDGVFRKAVAVHMPIGRYNQIGKGSRSFRNLARQITGEKRRWWQW